VRRSCGLAGFSKSGWYKRSTARDQLALRLRIREIAQARPRFGYTRIHVMLRREGWPVNKEACVSLISAGRAEIAHAGAGSQTHVSESGSDVSGAAYCRALEHGFRS